MVDFMGLINGGLLSRNQVAVVYTDFAQDLERVGHAILMNKIDYYFSFSPPLVSLIRCYLSNRQFSVRCVSCYALLQHRVSQKDQISALHSLLFL